MDPQKIISVIESCETRLQHLHIPKVRMDLSRTFGSLSREQLLMHGHYLCDGVKRYALDPQLQRKTGSHLTAVQMCLSFADWYTLEELMNHNWP